MAPGIPSIITGPIVCGHGTSGGPITPEGTSMSWIDGSPSRAAGNMPERSIVDFHAVNYKRAG
jgi:hypothetical protein